VSDIGWAVEQMLDGERVCRAAWSTGEHIALQASGENAEMTLPYVYLMMAQGQTAPWTCSQSDLLATDWKPAYD